MREIPNTVLYLNAPVAVANDYDGTLGKTGECPVNDGDPAPTDGSMGLLLHTVAKSPFELDPTAIISRWRQAEVSGTFFPFEEVEKQFIGKGLTGEDYDLFLKTYMANEDNVELLYPDTKQYLADLNGENGQEPVIHFTHTWGKRRADQIAKTTAAQLPGHVEYTDQKDKGFTIENEWLNPRIGRYEMAALTDNYELLAVIGAKKIIQVDDKNVSSNSLSHDNRGYRLNYPAQRQKPNQGGELKHPRIKTIKSLAEIAITLGMRLDLTQHPDAADIAGRITGFMPLTSYKKLD